MTNKSTGEAEAHAESLASRDAWAEEIRRRTKAEAQVASLVSELETFREKLYVPRGRMRKAWLYWGSKDIGHECPKEIALALKELDELDALLSRPTPRQGEDL